MHEENYPIHLKVKQSLQNLFSKLHQLENPGNGKSEEDLTPEWVVTFEAVDRFHVPGKHPHELIDEHQRFKTYEEVLEHAQGLANVWHRPVYIRDVEEKGRILETVYPENPISRVPDPEHPGETVFAPWRQKMLQFISSHYFGGTLSEDDFKKIFEIATGDKDFVSKYGKDWSFIRDADDAVLRKIHLFVKRRHPEPGPHKGFNPEKTVWRVHWEAGRNLHGMSRAFSTRIEAEKEAERLREELRNKFPGVSRKLKVWVKSEVGDLIENPNGQNDAADLFTAFHGAEPTQILNLQEKAMTEGDYTALGDLVRLVVELPSGKGAAIDFKGHGIKLASSAEGRQLWFVGGNQNLTPYLHKFKGIDTTKELVDLGEAHSIVYATRKDFDNFADVEYEHEFGEESGKRPRLAYHQGLHRLLLIGGNYRVERPGIID